MKPEPNETDKHPGEDLTAFEEIPSQAQEVLQPGDGSEKETGGPPADVQNQNMPLSVLTKL